MICENSLGCTIALDGRLFDRNRELSLVRLPTLRYMMNGGTRAVLDMLLCFSVFPSEYIRLLVRSHIHAAAAAVVSVHSVLSEGCVFVRKCDRDETQRNCARPHEQLSKYSSGAYSYLS